MLTTTQLAQQLSKLVSLRRSLSHEPGELERLIVERTADDLDKIHQLNERDLEARLLEARTSRLREIHAAMDRLREGSYGACSDCGEAINWRRLEALPWASRCTKCQGELESELSVRSGNPLDMEDATAVTRRPP